jgi:hypothetical protein
MTLNDKLENGLQRLNVQPYVGPVITTLLHLGLNEHDIIKVAERCHNNLPLLNGTSIKDILRKEIVNTIQNVMMIPMTNASLDINRTKATSNDKLN